MKAPATPRARPPGQPPRASAATRRGRTRRGCALPPPRGPRPSTVSGIVAAKWLASLAPPRWAAMTGRPSSSPARSSSGAVAARASIPGHSRARRSVSVAPPTSAGTAPSTRGEGVEAIGAHVGDQPPGGGDDVERVAAAHDGRDGGQAIGAARVVLGGDGLGGGREREQRVEALVGRRARVRAAAVREDLHGAGRLALDDDRVVAVGVELAGLEAQARVEAREAVDVAERADAPLLVDDEQQGDLGEELGPRAQRAQDAEREHVAALHVDGARAVEAVGVLGIAFERRGARRGRRRCRGGRAAGCAACRSPARARAGRGRGRATSTARAR